MSGSPVASVPPRPVPRALAALRRAGQRLSVRIALVVGLLAILFNVTLGGMLWSVVSAEMTSAVGREVVGAVERAADDLDERLSQRLAGLEQEAAAAVRLLLNQSPRPERAAQVLEPLHTLAAMFDSLTLVDADGVVVAGRPYRPNLIGLKIGDRSYFAHAQTVSKPFVTDPFHSRLTGRPMVNLVAPLRSADGRFLGLLMGGFDLQNASFAERIRSVRLGDSGGFSVETRNGLILVDYDPARVMQQRPGGAARATFERALAGRSSWHSAHEDGRELILAHRALANAPWVLGARLPRDEAFAAMTRLQGLTMVIRVGAGFLLLAFTGLIVSLMLRPLALLQRQVDEIEAGERKPRVATAGPVEIRRVAEAFNRLLDKDRQSAEKLTSQEAFHRTLINGSPVGVFVIDSKAQLTYASARCEQLLGRSAEQLCGWQWGETIHPDDRDGVRDAWLQARSRGVAFSREARVLRRNGEMLWLRVHAEPMVNPGHAPGYLNAVLDVTAEHAAAQALQRQRQQSDLILSTIKDALLVVDGQGRITHLSPAAERLTGWPRQSAAGVEVARVLRVRSENGSAGIDGSFFKAPQQQRDDALLESADGRLVPVEIVWSRFDDQDGGVLAVRDITERREASRRNEWEAMHDAVTGMPNRRAFTNAVDEAFLRYQRDRTDCMVVMIDLDFFKRVNDVGGHDAGDEMLQAVAELLSTSVRNSDLAARIGGDEFALLLPGCTKARAQSIAETIRIGIQALGVWRHGQRLTVGSSIGISSFDHRDGSAEDAQRRADEACYRAKNGGRNRVEVGVTTPTATAAA